jgi:glycine C-acetyltransferase
VTPIIPVMLGEARPARDLAKAFDERGVYVAGWWKFGGAVRARAPF